MRLFSLHDRKVASLGHVAVGMLLGRLHGGDASGPPRRRPWGAFILFGALAAFPDLDVVPVALGVSDGGIFGHRGASHSFVVALALGLLTARLGQRWGWPWTRTFVAATVAAGSHACLDMLGGGRGLLLFWPFCSERHESSWQLIEEAPRGLELFCHEGVLNVLHETLLFSPLVLGALWWPRRARPPQLTLVSPPPGTTENEEGEEEAPPARSAG